MSETPPNHPSPQDQPSGGQPGHGPTPSGGQPGFGPADGVPSGPQPPAQPYPTGAQPGHPQQHPGGAPPGYGPPGGVQGGQAPQPGPAQYSGYAPQPGYGPPTGAQPGYGPQPGHPQQPTGAQPGFPPPGYPPQGYAPPPGQAAAPGQTTSDETTWAMLAHLAGVIIACAGWLPALLVYLAKRNQSPFVRHHAAEALNFQLTLLVPYLIGCVVFVMLGVFAPTISSIGSGLIIVVWLLSIIFGVLASVAANRDVWYRYPVAIRLVR